MNVIVFNMPGTVISSQLPVDNLLIFLQTVVSAGYRKVWVIG